MPQPKNIPTEQDWFNPEPWDECEEEDAKKLFFGKSIAEVSASTAFTKGLISFRTCELAAISEKAFQYYIFALRDFTLSEGGEDPWIVKRCFIELIRDKLASTPNFILPIYDELKPTLEFIVSPDIDIFNDFGDIYGEILVLELAARSS